MLTFTSIVFILFHIDKMQPRLYILDRRSWERRILYFEFKLAIIHNFTPAMASGRSLAAYAGLLEYKKKKKKNKSRIWLSG